MLLQEQGWRKKCSAGVVQKATYIFVLHRPLSFIHPVDGHFTLVWGAGHPVDSCRRGRVPLVSIVTSICLLCANGPINSSSIHKEGSPPVRTTVTAGYFSLRRLFHRRSSFFLLRVVCRKVTFQVAAGKQLKMARVPYGSLRPANCKRFSLIFPHHQNLFLVILKLLRRRDLSRR